MLDFERISTSTRRASSGDSFPAVCAELAAADWAGVWAWQPGAASARQKVRARTDTWRGFTTVNTVPRLSHAEYLSSLSGSRFETVSPPLKQVQRASQVPSRPDIYQRDAELLFKLISHRAQFILANLYAEPAAIPVIRSLHRPILQQRVARNGCCRATRARTWTQIESKIARNCQPRLGRRSIPQQKPYLVEVRDPRCHAIRVKAARSIQPRIAHPAEDVALVRVHQHIVRSELLRPCIQIEVPLDIQVR